MPIYSFLNTETGEEFEEIMSYDSKLEFLEENPHIQSIITKALGLGYHNKGTAKLDGDFKDRLKEIKNSHYGSTIDVP